MAGDKNGAPLQRSGVSGLEHAIDLAQRVLLDERRNLYAAVEHELESVRVELRRTAPIANRAGVEGHQVGQPDLYLIHGEADHGECRPVIEKAECRLLAGAGARAFKNDPFALAQATLLREFL